MNLGCLLHLLCALSCLQDVQELVERLSEDSFDAREQASARLIELPLTADEAILQELGRASDPEVRWRLQGVMRARRVRHRAARLANELPAAFAAKYPQTLERAASTHPETQAALVWELDPKRGEILSREIAAMSGDDRRLFLAAIADNSDGEVRRAAVAAMFGPDGDLPLAFAERILRAMDESDPALVERAILRYRQEDAAGRRRPVEPWIRSANAELRAAAVTSLREKTYVEQVRIMLKDPAAGVRAAAAGALAAAGAREAAADVAALLADPVEEVRDAAAEALSGWPAEDLLATVASHPDRPAMRVLAAWKLPSSAPVALAFASNHRLRADALELLIELQAGEELAAALPLAPQLEEDQVDGLLGAVRKTRPQAAVDALLGLLDDERLRTRVLDLLGELRAPRAAAAAERFLKDEDAAVRAVAARCLGALGKRESGVRMVCLLADEDDGVRSAAIEAIATLRPPIEDSLTELLSGEDPRGRAAAATVLGKLGAAGRADALAALISDKEASVREAAIGAMQALGVVGSAFDRIVERLLDENATVRDTAALALATIRDPEGRAKLAGLLRHDSAAVRELAVRILRDDPAAARALEDPDARVRAAAAESLRHARYEDALARLLEDAEPAVRLAAAESLVRLGRSRIVLNAASRADGTVRWRLFWLLNLAVQPDAFLDAERPRPKPVRLGDLRLEFPPEFSGDPLLTRGEAAALLEAACGDSFACVLEFDRIRIVPIAEAVEFWKETLR